MFRALMAHHQGAQNCIKQLLLNDGSVRPQNM